MFNEHCTFVFHSFISIKNIFILKKRRNKKSEQPLIADQTGSSIFSNFSKILTMSWVKTDIYNVPIINKMNRIFFQYPTASYSRTSRASTRTCTCSRNACCLGATTTCATIESTISFSCSTRLGRPIDMGPGAGFWVSMAGIRILLISG